MQTYVLSDLGDIDVLKKNKKYKIKPDKHKLIHAIDFFLTFVHVFLRRNVCCQLVIVAFGMKNFALVFTCIVCSVVYFCSIFDVKSNSRNGNFAQKGFFAESKRKENKYLMYEKLRIHFLMWWLVFFLKLFYIKRWLKRKLSKITSCAILVLFCDNLLFNSLL